MEVKLHIARFASQDISFFKGIVVKIVQTDTLAIPKHLRVKVILKIFRVPKFNSLNDTIRLWLFTEHS